MNSNIEIKAVVSDIKRTIYLAEQVSDSEAEIINQKDIYYNIPKGRLKLRILNTKRGELIFYTRDNTYGPKTSLYSIYSTAAPGALNATMSKSFGILGKVEKKRLLFITGQTRIHIDDVKDLGYFIELEVVLRQKQEGSDGIDIANDIMERLHISKESLIKYSYIDLILNESTHETQKIKD